jgi:hypothetical protein
MVLTLAGAHYHGTGYGLALVNQEINIAVTVVQSVFDQLIRSKDGGQWSCGRRFRNSSDKGRS